MFNAHTFGNVIPLKLKTKLNVVDKQTSYELDRNYFEVTEDLPL